MSHVVAQGHPALREIECATRGASSAQWNHMMLMEFMASCLAQLPVHNKTILILDHRTLSKGTQAEVRTLPSHGMHHPPHGGQSSQPNSIEDTAAFVLATPGPFRPNSRPIEHISPTPPWSC